jgi:hypothetical protein
MASHFDVVPSHQHGILLVSVHTGIFTSRVTTISDSMGSDIGFGSPSHIYSSHEISLDLDITYHRCRSVTYQVVHDLTYWYFYESSSSHVPYL